MNTNDLSRRRNKAFNGILASKCQLTAVFVGKCLQITIVYKFPQNPKRLFGNRNPVLSKFNTVDLYNWCCIAFTCAIFRLENTHNVTEIPCRSDQKYE